MNKKIGMILLRIKTDIINAKWVILGLTVYYLITYLLFQESCTTRILTGFPCPGCGMTRAMILLLTGHLAESMQMHPMAPLWLLLGIIFFIRRYVLGRELHEEKKIGIWAVVLCVCMVGLYIYRMMKYFPNQVPLVYSPTKISMFLKVLTEIVAK